MEIKYARTWHGAALEELKYGKFSQNGHRLFQEKLGNSEIRNMNDNTSKESLKMNPDKNEKAK